LGEERDVLNLLAKISLAKSQTDGKKNRLRTLKNLAAAALKLAIACRIFLNPATEDKEIESRIKSAIAINEDLQLKMKERESEVASPSISQQGQC
jgi:hypothetical protein